MSKEPSILTKSKFTEELFERVLVNLKEGRDTHPAIELEGISKSHFYDKLTERPDLAERFKQAQFDRDRIRNARRIERAEEELARRGIDGWEEPVFDVKGNHCGNKRRYSDACLIFMLKSLKPEVYTDKPHTLVQNNVGVAQKSGRDLLLEWQRKLGMPPPKDVDQPPKKQSV